MSEDDLRSLLVDVAGSTTDTEKEESTEGEEGLMMKDLDGAVIEDDYEEDEVVERFRDETAGSYKQD